MERELLAGFGEADIIPDGRVVELSGQYYRRISEGMHSRLKAVVLYLEQKKRSSVMVALDVVGLPDVFCAKAAGAVSDNFKDISPSDVIINATHTHNAPALGWGRNWWELHPEAVTVEEFNGLVQGGILKAVQDAYDSRKPAGIGFSTQYSCTGHPRRAVYADGTAEMYGDTKRDDFTGMEGGEDSGVELMYLFDESKKPFGAVVNVACPSQVMEARRVVSSDYMGALREKLKGEYGEGFNTVCQVSAAGCQSPRDLTRNDTSLLDFWGEKGVEVIAERIFRAVKEGSPAARDSIDCKPELLHKKRKIKLPLRRVSYIDFKAAREKMERLEKEKDSKTAYREFCDEVKTNENIKGRPGPYDSKLHHFVDIRRNEAIVKRYEEQFENPFVEIDIHCLRLGQAAFATNPFELFLEYGQRIKARSTAEKTFLIQLANGSCSYLPSKTAEINGGYGGEIMNGKVGSEGGSMLVDESVDCIAGLF